MKTAEHRDQTCLCASLATCLTYCKLRLRYYCLEDLARHFLLKSKVRHMVHSVGHSCAIMQLTSALIFSELDAD